MEINKFAVIGHPIGHTMSPFIHKVLFELSGFSPKYDILDIENVMENKELLKTYDGLNVTIPHKANIMELADEIDAKAKRFGSVNTIKNESGKISGYTTDGIGAVKALFNMNANYKGKVLILGNGGAARAIAFELDDNNADITIAGRSKEKAKVLADELTNAKYCTIEEVENNDVSYDVLVNATSVGMYPKCDACPVKESLVKRCESVFDIVYNPQDTQLINLAKALGKNIVYGMDMLVLQAVVAHEIWYGAKFEREDITKLIQSAKEECIRLFGN